MAPQKSDENVERFHCRPSELPAYTPLHSSGQKLVHAGHKPNGSSSPLHGAIESGVRVVRTELQGAVSAVSQQTDKLSHYYETGKAHTQHTIDLLNEPQNVMHRSGAIALGGLSGLVLAARGGFFKKLFYSAAGAGAIASLCYPRQAEVVAREALHEARKGATITYNFVKGVKPGDEVPFEPLKNFPTNVEDVKFMLWDFYDEIKETIMPSKK